MASIESTNEWNTEFEWVLKEEDESLSTFLQCPTKQRMNSPSFHINDLSFSLEAYPNGDSEGNKGRVMLYCTLLSLKESHQEIMVNVRLFCRDTNTSFTSIARLTSRQNSAGWTPDTLRLDEVVQFTECSDLSTVTVGCTLRVLQITDIGNEVIFRCDPPSELKAKYALKWRIGSELMEQFKHCRAGRCFESEVVDGMWCLRCHPNGRGPAGGNVKLYLLLCTAPTAVHSENEVLIQYTMWCQETDSGYNSRIALNADYPTIGWPNKIMLSSQLDALDAMTLNAEIEILRKHGDAPSDGDSDGDDSDYSSSSSYRAVKGLVDGIDGIDGLNVSDPMADGDEKEEFAPNPPQIAVLDVMSIGDGVDDDDDAQSLEDPVSDKALDAKPEVDDTADPEGDLKEEPEPAMMDEVVVPMEQRLKSKRKRRGMTVEEFVSIPLDDLVDPDIESLDHYAMAKRICHFFDAQFGDTDTVCLVAESGKQPAFSYWVRDRFVRKQTHLFGRHVLIYRACGHRAAKQPVVTQQEFEEFVKGISIGNDQEPVDAIADQMDERFGAGCHFARSTAKKADFDIYCRFSDKYECAFKLPTGGYVIAWRR